MYRICVTEPEGADFTWREPFTSEDAAREAVPGAEGEFVGWTVRVQKFVRHDEDSASWEDC